MLEGRPRWVGYGDEDGEVRAGSRGVTMACAFNPFPLPSRSMFELNRQNELEGAEKRLEKVGYWPAIAAAAFASGKYSRVV